MTAQTNNRWTALVALGLASGLAQVTAGVTMYLAGVYFASWSAWVSLGVLSACLVAGLAWYRRHVLDGRTTYWLAFGAGIVIAALTGLTYVTYNVISVSLVYPHFLDDMIQAQFRMSQEMGLSPSLERLRAENTLGMIVRTNFAAFVIAGTALSALVATAFRRRRQPLAAATAGV